MRARLRISRNDIVLLLTRGPIIGRTIFIFLCLLTLISSSFRPAAELGYAMGGADSSAELVSSTSDQDAPPAPELYYTVYQVSRGDTISNIADRFSVSQDTLYSSNNITSAKALKPGQLLKVPSLSGIVYQAKPGESVEAIAQKYDISADKLIEVNGLLSRVFDSSATLFLPDAKLPRAVFREISGDLFRWPVRGVITSWFSWRRDPFSGRNSFHNGLDIAVPLRSPVGAAMEGVVAETGYSATMGRYVIMTHSGGYRTLYGHMDSVSVQAGTSLARGGRLGYSGNTGYSTGPHLHFSVYKNGRLINPANVLQ